MLEGDEVAEADVAARFDDRMNAEERAFACLLWLRKQRELVASFEYEKTRLQLCKRFDVWFVPDFVVTMPDGRKVVYELKRRESDANQLKTKWAASLWPGTEFVIVTPARRRKSTSRWAFRYTRFAPLEGGRTIP